MKLNRFISVFSILLLLTGMVSSDYVRYDVDESGSVTKIETDEGILGSSESEQKNYDYSSELRNTVGGADKIKLIDYIKDVYKSGFLVDDDGKLKIITTVGLTDIREIDIPTNARVQTSQENGETRLEFEVRTSTFDSIENRYLNYQSCISANSNPSACSADDWQKEAGQFKYGAENAKMIYSVSPNGDETIEMFGTGSIVVGNQVFTNIKDAKFKVDKDGNILYARFTALTESYSSRNFNHEIKFKDDTLRFRPNKNGFIEVDVENNVFRAENMIDVSWGGYRFWMGEDTASFDKKNAKGKVEVKFNDDGSVKQVKFTGGQLVSPEGSFSSSRGEVTMVYDPEDYDALKDKTDNLILSDDEKLTLKGSIDAQKFGEWALEYHGRDGSLMEYEKRAKKISLKEGDALIRDPNYEIEVKGGEEYFKKIGEKDYLLVYSLFTFEHTNVNGALETINFENDHMVLTKSKDGNVVYKNIIDEKLSRTALSTKEIIFAKFQNDLLSAKKIAYEETLAGLDKSSKKWYDTNLARIKNDVQIGISGGEKVATTVLEDIGETISRLETEYRNNPNDPVVKKTLATYLDYQGELMRQKLSESYYQYRVGEPDEKGVQKIELFSGGKLMHGGYRIPPSYLNNYDDQDASFTGFNLYGANDVYQGLIDDQEAAIRSFQRAHELGLYSDGEFELKKMDVMILAGEYNIARDQANDMIKDIAPTRGGTEEDFALASQAYTKLGTAIFLQGGDMKGVDDAIKEAIQWDPSNKEAQTLQTSFQHAQANAVSKVAKDEGRNTFRDLGVLTGDLGAGNGWQRLADIGAIIGSPWTTGYKLRNFGSYLSQAQINIDRATQVGLAAEQMTQLIENGVSLGDYGHNLGYSEKFLAIYFANGYDDILPAEQLSEVFESSEYKNAKDSQKLEVMLSKLEEMGYSRDSPDLQRRFYDTMKNMALIDYATKGDGADPTLKSLMYGGEFVEVGDRLGESISLNTAEYSALFAADIVLNPLNLIGAGFAARGEMAATTGLKLALRMEINSGTANTLKAWGGITTKQLMKAYLAEVMIDSTVTLSLTGLAKVNPDLAKNVGLGLGIVMGTTFVGGGLMKLANGADEIGVKVFSDLSDGSTFYVRNADDLAKLESKMTDLRMEDGVLKGKLGDTDVTVGVRNADGLYEVETLAKLKTQAESVVARNTQEALQDARNSNLQGGCFLAGTKILMADGSYKNIEDILLGDKVVAYDLVNDIPVESEVSTTFKRVETKYYIIEYEVVK